MSSRMAQRTSKNVNNCFNTNIYFNSETSGDQSLNQYLNVVHFFNTSVNYASVAAYDSCFSSLVSIVRCSIVVAEAETLDNFYACLIRLI